MPIRIHLEFYPFKILRHDSAPWAEGAQHSPLAGRKQPRKRQMGNMMSKIYRSYVRIYRSAFLRIRNFAMKARTASTTQARHVVRCVAAAESRFSRNHAGLMASLGFAAFLLVSAPALAVATAPSL